MAAWEDGEPPVELAHVIAQLEKWGSEAVRGRGVSRRVRVRPAELTALLLGDELVDVALEEAYLADPDVPLDHLKFVIGHEMGEFELRGRLTGKPKEHAADCVAAELVGTEVAVAALDGHRRWQKVRGADGDDVASDTHPSVDERIRRVRERSS